MLIAPQTHLFADKGGDNEAIKGYGNEDCVSCLIIVLTDLDLGSNAKELIKKVNRMFSCSLLQAGQPIINI